MDQFQAGPNLIMACHFTGIYDVNRSTTLPDDDFSLVQDWVNAIEALGLQGVLFHNNFSAETCACHQSRHVQFLEVAYHPPLNPNVFRYLVYRDFLAQQADFIQNVFVTDVGDVVVCQNPFIAPLFLEKTGTLFCGDEPKLLGDAWMMDHSTHLRSKIADYGAFEADFKEATLLNCGVFGGNIAIMQSFLADLCTLHTTYNVDNKTAYTGDMGAFNYLVRSRYHASMWHGAPVNTVFKNYETARRDCWFRHK